MAVRLKLEGGKVGAPGKSAEPITVQDPWVSKGPPRDCYPHVGGRPGSHGSSVVHDGCHSRARFLPVLKQVVS